MRSDVLAVAAALAIQAAVVAAIPMHETFVRATGRTVVLAVDPVDPYDPVRGYHADFKYAGLSHDLPGFDRMAAGGSPAWVVLERNDAGDGLRPVRVVRSPGAAGGAAVLRAHYVVPEQCYQPDDASRCRSLHATPDAWYADEAAVTALSEALRDHQAVAELRVTADGDASLLRLRPSRGKMGHGG